LPPCDAEPDADLTGHQTSLLLLLLLLLQLPGCAATDTFVAGLRPGKASKAAQRGAHCLARSSDHRRSVGRSLTAAA